MELLHEPVVLIHLLGFAVLLGSIFFYRKGNNLLALWAAVIQLISGAFLMFSGEAINHMKVGMKLLILLLIIILLLVWRKKAWTKEQRYILMILVLVNLFLAVLW